jgi:hypothetical protein
MARLLRMIRHQTLENAALRTGRSLGAKPR